MGRFLFLALCLLLLIIVGGVLVLGTFPPGPRTEQVQRVLPNDRFQPK